MNTFQFLQQINRFSNWLVQTMTSTMKVYKEPPTKENFETQEENHQKNYSDQKTTEYKIEIVWVNTLFICYLHLVACYTAILLLTGHVMIKTFVFRMY